MRLTAYTDYSLRTLIYLAMNREQLVTIQEIADAHGIAKNHLTKVVHRLGTLGFDAVSAGCMYSAACALKGVLGKAVSAFLEVLDAVTLEQMVVKEGRTRKAIGMPKTAVVQFKSARQKA